MSHYITLVVNGHGIPKQVYIDEFNVHATNVTIDYAAGDFAQVTFTVITTDPINIKEDSSNREAYAIPKKAS